jgi:hypothetical protein
MLNTRKKKKISDIMLFKIIISCKKSLKNKIVIDNDWFTDLDFLLICVGGSENAQ